MTINELISPHETIMASGGTVIYCGKIHNITITSQFLYLERNNYFTIQRIKDIKHLTLSPQDSHWSIWLDNIDIGFGTNLQYAEGTYKLLKKIWSEFL